MQIWPGLALEVGTELDGACASRSAWALRSAKIASSSSEGSDGPDVDQSISKSLAAHSLKPAP